MCLPGRVVSVLLCASRGILSFLLSSLRGILSLFLSFPALFLGLATLLLRFQHLLLCIAHRFFCVSGNFGEWWRGDGRLKRHGGYGSLAQRDVRLAGADLEQRTALADGSDQFRGDLPPE